MVGHGTRSSVRQHLIAPEDAGQRLDKILAGLLPGAADPHIRADPERRGAGQSASAPARTALDGGDRVRVPPVTSAR